MREGHHAAPPRGLHWGQGNVELELLQGHPMYGKHSGAICVSGAPCGLAATCSGVIRAGALGPQSVRAPPSAAREEELTSLQTGPQNWVKIAF